MEWLRENNYIAYLENLEKLVSDFLIKGDIMGDKVHSKMGAKEYHNRKDSRWLEEQYPEFSKWLTSISRFSLVDNVCIIMDRGGGRVSIKIATERNTYSISAHKPDDNRRGYLGCIASIRKPRFGEDWTRGNDLHDGPYSEETWNGILSDIVSYELKESIFAKVMRG